MLGRSVGAGGWCVFAGEGPFVGEFAFSEDGSVRGEGELGVRGHGPRGSCASSEFDIPRIFSEADSVAVLELALYF